MLGGALYPPAWAGGRSSAYFPGEFMLALTGPLPQTDCDLQYLTTITEANSLSSFPVQSLDGWGSLLNHPSYHWSTIWFPRSVFSLAPVSSSVKTHKCPSDVYPLGFQVRRHWQWVTQHAQENDNMTICIYIYLKDNFRYIYLKD